MTDGSAITVHITCPACNRELDEKQYYLRETGKRRKTCKRCTNKAKSESVQRDPVRRAARNKRASDGYKNDPVKREKRLKYGKRWREQHPDLKGYMDAAAKRHYQRNIDRMREKGREKYRKDPEAGRQQACLRNYKIYGLTEEEFLVLLQKQNGVCAICGRPERRKIRGRVTRLSVDHCHKTGRVRGLLCAHCNSKLSLVEQLVDHMGIDLVIERLRQYLGV